MREDAVMNRLRTALDGPHARTLLFAVVAFASNASLYAQIDDKLLSATSTMVVAHRGCWQHAPENSVAAVQACIELGVDMVEVDVRQTSDGVLILMHDDSVDRTTDGSGSVSSMTYAKIQALRLRENAGGPDAALTPHKVPTLAEFMSVVRNRILVNIDAKSDVFEAVAAELAELDILDHVVMKLEVPPDHPLLRGAPFMGNTHFMPKITQGGVPLSMFALEYAFTQPVAFELKFETEAYLVEGVSAIVNMDARIWVNTLEPDKCAYHHDTVALQDPVAHWGRLVDLGVNMIQTDYPGALLKYLASR